MTAKDKIISAILDEAKLQADDIIKEAHKNAEEIKNEAFKEAEDKCKKIISEAEKKAVTIGLTGESSAALMKRDKLLACKQELIEQLLQKVNEEINAMPDKEYFDYLTEILDKNSAGAGGVLMLSLKDLSRNTKDFGNQISKRGLKLSETPVNISGGFILKYGDIEINCDIKALINEKREKIIDIANKMLF